MDDRKKKEIDILFRKICFKQNATLGKFGYHLSITKHFTDRVIDRSKSDEFYRIGSMINAALNRHLCEMIYAAHLYTRVVIRWKGYHLGVTFNENKKGITFRTFIYNENRNQAISVQEYILDLGEEKNEKV